jgi:hypothetical protein
MNFQRSLNLKFLRAALPIGALAVAMLFGDLAAPALAQPSILAVSRVKYEGNTFGDPATFPDIFLESSVSGVQGQIFIDHYVALPGFPRFDSIPLTGISTSFSSKSEGALMRSPDGYWLTYMGYAAAVGATNVSNSYDTGAGTDIQGDTNLRYDRAVALIAPDGSYTVTNESNAYSGDNPRAAITVNGLEFYMAGNSDSTTYPSANPFAPGPGSTIGARYGTPGSTSSYQLGVYTALDRSDETTKQHFKDNNFRGIGIYNNTLYVSKGSGGNGDDGLFQVGASGVLPKGTTNTISVLFGAPATCPNPPVAGQTCTPAGASSPLVPFGFWFATPNIVYVADEGNPNLDASGNLIPDPLAGLEKWKNVNGKWQLLYTLQAGLGLYQPVNVPGYPVPTYTYGLRNMTGQVDGFGFDDDTSVTIYAITAQYSTISGGEPDPTRLVAITDDLNATSPPFYSHFTTLASSQSGEVFRGVALAPCFGFACR